MNSLIGIDYGTDSVRAVLVDTEGNQLAGAEYYYPRWKDRKYCNSAANQFRHHPLDYMEGLEQILGDIVAGVSGEIVKNIKGISVDTTGSTPVAVNKKGTPLALLNDFRNNPEAMFILWKDHTAVKEASEITEYAKQWDGPDFTKYSGGIYSSEWFWAKILHTIRKDPAIREAAYSWVELCDWIPYLLTGGNDIRKMKRSRCAAGHKALWHEEFGGLPPEDFFTGVDPLLAGLRERLYDQTYTADQPAGTISAGWAEKLGLPENVVIGTGAFDAHMGAVGGEIEPYHLSRVMGTSTCDILVAPKEDMEGKLVKGICGQVDGSVIPGMTGLEAGQSGFGDVYAWFKDILMWPLINMPDNGLSENENRQVLLQEINDRIISELSEKAAEIEINETDTLALDWHNGRRTPDANQLLKGAVEGIDLGTDAPKIFKALVESTCFGAKAIVQRFHEEGIPIKGVIGLGGVAKKSPFVMQTLANVLGMPIKIAKSEQSCALGAAMFAAVAAGLFEDVSEAIHAMGSGFEKVYKPDQEKTHTYEKLYSRYLSFGRIAEERTEKQNATKQLTKSEFRELKQAAYESNMKLPELGLVLFTFGNASAADHERGVFAIKPSGVPYNELDPDDMVIVDFDSRVVEGNLRPSSDTKTHALLYKHWEKIGGIVHTHSTYGTAWAQAGRDIPVLGTTHADHLTEGIPCTEVMSDEMIRGDYEEQTGYQIIHALKERTLSYKEVEMILVAGHAPFTWGSSVEKAVYNSAVLEEIAKMASLTLQINPGTKKLKNSLIRKHWERKHGDTAHYGQ